jgi:hypothetical protein
MSRIVLFVLLIVFNSYAYQKTTSYPLAKHGSKITTYAQKTKKSKKKEEPKRCALPAPFDSIFPITEYLGPTLGVPDTDPEYPLTKSLWKAYPCLKKQKVKFYGWINPSFNLSSSKHSNVPLGFDIVPNRLELQELVVRFERNPDTVQRCYTDWGFRFSNLFGIDYRFTITQGIFSNQLLKHNNLYGYDPVEMYGQLYFPCIAQGILMTIGRYLSPADIDSTLSPDNYLFTHSLMSTYDIETETGINAAIKFNNYWTILIGVHAGGDLAPWAKGAHPSLLAMARWVSCNNNDSLWGGIVSYNGGKFKGNFDNLQEFSFAWTHRFNKCFLSSTQVYYMYQIDSPKGGTCNFGPFRYGTGGGCGPLIPGYSSEIGAVNYIELKTSDKDFISFRTDLLDDINGERTGFATPYLSFTFGLTHEFTQNIRLRPELRYEFAFQDRPYDNGTKKQQATFNVDMIFRF